MPFSPTGLLPIFDKGCIFLGFLYSGGMIKDNIREQCRIAGTSQAGLARNMRMTRQRLSRIINTPYRLSVDHLEDMTVHLGCALPDLLGYDGKAQAKLDEVTAILLRRACG